MKRNILAVLIVFACQAASAAGNATHLSCPGLDKRADDLLVVIDQSGGTASLQSGKSGVGLNFTSQAAFGPSEITWRNDSKGIAQKFSVDRVSLMLKRETTSAMTGSTYVETSPCSIAKAPANTKI